MSRWCNCMDVKNKKLRFLAICCKLSYALKHFILKYNKYFKNVCTPNHN